MASLLAWLLPSQASGMLSRDQLLRLFADATAALDKPEVKQRIVEGVRSGKEAALITTEIQEELLLAMGVEPKFGIACLAKVNTVYRNDQELITKFYTFVAREELACDEAELSPEAFMEKKAKHEQAQEAQQQLLQQMRGLPPEQQQAYLRQLQSEIQSGQQSAQQGYKPVMTPEEMRAFFQRQQQTSDSLQASDGTGPDRTTAPTVQSWSNSKTD
eukprot:SM000015S01219  [mRNA]  locus=s15:622240:624003:+ [translate_table: standard]